MELTWSAVGILIGSIVCFCMFAHPMLPRVMLLPQYSQVIIISPNFGLIGAAQLGHFSEVAPVGAKTGPALAGPGPD